MPIPARFQLPTTKPEWIKELSSLCDAIEDARSDEDAAPLLEKWHRRANRKYQRVEFRTYYGAISKEEFIREALQPVPNFVEDLTYDEAKDVIKAVAGAELRDQAETSYYLQWLQVNLPGSEISNLIFWPNCWFRNDSLFLGG